MKLVFMTLLFIVELLIMLNYFKNMFEQKFKTCKTALIYIAGYILLFGVYCLAPRSFIVNGAAFLAVNTALSFICFDIRLKSALFHCSVAAAAMLATDMITIYANSALLGETPNHYNNSIFLFAVNIVICKTLFFLAMKIIYAVARKNKAEYDYGKYWLLMILPLSSVFCALLLNYFIGTSPLEPLAGFLCSAFMFLLLITNIIVFWLYENMQKNSHAVLELQIAGQKEKQDMAYLEMLEKKNISLERLVHDFKNHLSAVKSLADSPQVSKYIDGVYGSVEKYEYIGKTSNHMLDLILSKYTTLCESSGIDFTAETYSENLKFMDDFDLSSLMNNLLDNAMEAAAKTLHGRISLIIKRNESSKRIIDISNSCPEEPKTKNGRLISTKTGGIHGIGTKNIKAAAEKYGGDCEWMYDGISKTFRVIIVFPAPENRGAD